MKHWSLEIIKTCEQHEVGDRVYSSVANARKLILEGKAVLIEKGEIGVKFIAEAKAKARKKAVRNNGSSND